MFFSLLSRFRVRVLILVAALFGLMLGLAYQSVGQLIVHALVMPWFIAAIALVTAWWIAEGRMARRARAPTAMPAAEQLLAKWKDIFENISVGIVIVNSDQHTLDLVNPAFAAMHGYTVEELIGKPLQILVDQSISDSSQAWIRALSEQPEIHPTIEALHRRKDGSTFPVLLDATIVRDEHDAILYHIVTAQDLSVLKRAEIDLQRQTLELATITQLSREIIQTPGLKTTLDSIARLTAASSQSDGAIVFAIDPDGRPRTASIFNVSESLIQALAEHDLTGATGAFQRAILEHRPIQIADVWADADYAFRQQVAAAGFRSVLAVPMLRQDQAIGGLILFQCEPRSFPSQQLAFLQAIAQQCVNAVENAQLYEAERKERELAEALRDLAAALTSTLDFNQILNRILDTIGRVVPYDTATILLLENGVGRVVGCRGFAERGLESWIFSKRFPIQEFVSIYELKTHQRPTLISDTRTFPGWVQFPETDWIRSALRVPIKLRGELIGVMSLDSAKPNYYTKAQAAGLEAFADQAAVALENARLLGETKERADQFTALYETTRDLAGHQDLPMLLNMVVERAIKILHASAGDMFLHDPKNDDLYLVAEKGLKNPPGIRVKLGEGMAGLVAQTRQPMIVSDYHTWEHRMPQYDAIPFASVLQVPLLYNDELIGVLNVNEIAPSTRQFTDSDMRLLSLFAGQAANAIHSARLLAETRTRAEQLALLYDASLALNSVLEPRTQLEFLFKIATQAIRVERAEFFRLDKERQQIHLELCIGGDERLHATLTQLRDSLDDDKSIVSWVCRNRLPLYLPDVRSDSRWIAFDPTVRSALWVPVEHEDKLLGVFCVLSPQVDAFTLQDERLLVLFANQTAVALENARLFAEAQQRANRLTILNDIANAVNQSTNLDQLLEIIYQHISTTMKADAICIALYDAATNELDLRVRMDEGVRMAPERYPLGRGLRTRVIETKKSLLIGDLQTAQDLPTPVLWGSMKPSRAWLGVPMKLGNQVIGLIVMESYEPNVYSQEEEQLLITIADHLVLAIQKARLFEEAQRRADRLAILNHIARVASQTLSMDELLELVCHQVLKVLKPDAICIGLYDPGLHELDFRLRIDEGVRSVTEQRAVAVGLNARLIESRRSLLIRDALALEPPPPTSLWGSMKPARSWLGAPMKLGETILGIINVQAYAPDIFDEEDEQLLVTIADQVALAIQKAQLFEETQHRLVKLEAVSKISTALRTAQKLDEMLPLLLDETLSMIGNAVGAILLYDAAHDELSQAVARGWFLSTPPRVPARTGIAGKVFYEGNPYVARNFKSDPVTSELARSNVPGEWGGAFVPIRTTQEIIGVLAVAVQVPREIRPDQVHLLTAIAEMAGIAIQRTQLHQQTEERLNRMNAMHVIDTAISASLDLRVVMNVFLGQATSQLQVDAANVLVLNPHDQTLSQSYSRGIQFNGVARTSLHLGEGYPGRTVMQRQRLHVADLQTVTDDRRLERLASEGWVSYFAVPLVSKGQAQGVLEIFHRVRFEPDIDWLGFLDILAGQAAIAIENVTLFENLQRTNLDLSLAYDSTIESWARSLDLRMEGMEGHSERLIDLTLRLAHVLGMENELPWIRRGVLLHDIGKLSIPDTILVKPARLTEYEWQVIRKHPQYAHNLLASIDFMRPALDIPYCHHEKWDGTGYPRGLKGMEIPLAARLFAIVDVWDALRSARPYRGPWTDVQAREYIRSQSGKHFDPQIVKVFMNLLDHS